MIHTKLDTERFDTSVGTTDTQPWVIELAGWELVTVTGWSHNRTVAIKTTPRRCECVHCQQRNHDWWTK